MRVVLIGGSYHGGVAEVPDLERRTISLYSKNRPAVDAFPLRVDLPLEPLHFLEETYVPADLALSIGNRMSVQECYYRDARMSESEALQALWDLLWERVLDGEPLPFRFA